MNEYCIKIFCGTFRDKFKLRLYWYLRLKSFFLNNIFISSKNFCYLSRIIWISSGDISKKEREGKNMNCLELQGIKYRVFSDIYIELFPVFGANIWTRVYRKFAVSARWIRVENKKSLNINETNMNIYQILLNVCVNQFFEM